MKPTVSKIVLAATAILLSFSILTYAQPNPKGARNAGKGMGMGYCLNSVNLTADQKNEIDKLIQQHQTQMIDFRSQIDKINIQIADERNKQSPDFNKIKQLITQKNDIKNKMDMARVEHQQQVYSKLTDEQKKQIYQNRPVGAGYGKGYGKGYGRCCGYGYGYGYGNCWRNTK